MKKFNKEIKVTVSIDAIAQKLLDTFPADYKHRDIVAEAIIGGIVANGVDNICYLYNALGGYTNDIDFVIGETIICTDKEYNWTPKEDTDSYKRDFLELGEVKIVDIDLYADRKIQVEFQFTNEKGETKPMQSWVYHSSCTKKQAQIVEMQS